MEFKKILVPVDFSDCSNKALEYAILFGEKYGAVLTLFHVVALFQEDVGETERMQELEEIVKRQEEKIRKQMSGSKEKVTARGVSVNTVIQRGINPADTILEFLDEQDFDLVIMGTHGRTGLKHVLQGSVAEKVVRLSPVPVLTIHREVQKYDFDDIVVPIDFSAHSLKAVEYATDLAQTFNSRLHFLHVIEQEIHPSFYAAGVTSIFEIDHDLKERVVENMQEFVEDFLDESMTTEYVVREGKAHREIVEFAKEKGMDLIVIATHGLSGLEYLLLGSTTEKVVRWATCPVLTVKSETEEN